MESSIEKTNALMSQMMTLLDHIGIPDDDKDFAPSVGDRVPLVKFGESLCCPVIINPVASCS